MTPTIPGLPPYRIDIQQGNFVSQEMVSQLKPGMSREQVRFVLGTPLVTDIFHADRWDYVYFRDPPGKPREQRRLSVFFQDNKLTRVGGDVVPASPADPDAGPTPPAARPPAAPAAKPQPAEAKPVPAKASPVPPLQNWSAASDLPPPPAEPSPAPEPKPKPAAEPKPAAGAQEERGFFGRMLDRLKGSE